MPITTNNEALLSNLSTIDPSIIKLDAALKRAVRVLHVGIVNLMPDKAIRSTERQFSLPLHFASGRAYVVPHFITLNGAERDEDAQKYVDKNYITFDQAKDHGMDALIITGANVEGTDLTNTPFYKELTEVFDWAKSDTGPTSTLTSCLATHALVQHLYQQKRQPTQDGNKRWGVYEHAVKNRKHPLTMEMDSVFDVPHSRWNEISETQFIASGMHILVDSKEAGVHMATSPDGIRFVTWQGHPEYDTISLLKEWSRDLGEKRLKQINPKNKNIELPPFPNNYFKGKSLDIVQEIHNQVSAGHLDDDIIKNEGLKILPTTELEIVDNIPTKWKSSRMALFSNWLRVVGDITNEDTKKPFMDGVNPENPLNLPSIS